MSSACSKRHICPSDHRSRPGPFDTHLLDDQPADVRSVVGGATPAVVASTGDGPVLLLGPDDLEACQASPDELVARLRSAVEQQHLEWPH